MTKLHQIITALLQDIVHAGAASDIYSRDLSRKYSSDPILRQFSVPRAQIKEVTLDLKLALTKAQLENGDGRSGFNAEAIFNAFIRAIQSASDMLPWQIVVNSIFTPEFLASLLSKFDLNLRTAFIAPGIEMIDVEENWQEISRRFESALEENVQAILQVIGQEVLGALVARLSQVTNAQFLLSKLATEIEQALQNDEAWVGLIEVLPTFIQTETLSNLFQQEINPLIGVESPANRASLFNQNFELQTEALAENLGSIFIELLFFAIEESGEEEIAAHVEALGFSQVQERLSPIAMETLGTMLNSLAQELRTDAIIQRYLHSLGSKVGEGLMELIQATAVTPDFRQSFQEQGLHFITTQEFHQESVEAHQQAVTMLFLSQLPEFNNELRQVMSIGGGDVTRIEEMALQMLTGNDSNEANIESNYDLDVEVDSARLQQLPPGIISSLQLTIALDDDLWPTVVADT